jgi:hypothetical protein
VKVSEADREKDDRIGIQEVAAIFDVTTWQGRRYEAARIVVRIDRVRNKLVFSRADTLWAHGRWEELRSENTVVQAGRTIDAERRRRESPKRR